MSDKKREQKERIASVSRRPGEALHPTDGSHKEVVGQRQRNSKTFHLGGGRHKLLIGKSPVHYRKGGRWHDIDLTIVEKHGDVGVDKAPYKLTLFTDRVGYTYISRRGGRIDVELVEVGDDSVDYNNLTISKDGNQFFWDGISPGLRFKAQLKPQGVEIFKELADDEAPRRFVWRVRQDVDAKCNFESKSSGYDSALRKDRTMNRLRRLEMINEAHPATTIVDDDGRQYKQFIYEERWTGRLSTIKDQKTRQKRWTTEAIYPVIIDVLVTESIAATADDGTQYWDMTPVTPANWYSTLSTNLVGWRITEGTVNMDAGFRFTTIPVPQGATIDSAVLKFFAFGYLNPGGCPTLIQADDVDDAPIFSSSNLPRGITPTAASTAFTFAYGTTFGWTTANVTGIVQEIANRGGWTSGNDMAFAVFRQLTMTTNIAYIRDYTYNPAEAAILEINYTVPPPPGSSRVCRAFPILAITDGMTRINLHNCGRWSLSDWQPFIPGAKGGGTWQDSPLSPGRQLVDYQRTNWIDVFTLLLQQPNQDSVIFQEQELLRLLEKAIQYWTSNWQNEPVWIEVRAAHETNLRYGVIKGYRTPRGSGNPFGQPFILPEPKSVIEDFQLTIEHGPWLADQPGTGTCVEISGKQISPPFHMLFNGDTSEINCGSDAALDNLPNADFTMEAWILADEWGGIGNTGSFIFNKHFMWLFLNPVDGIRITASFVVQPALSTSGLDDFTLDGLWHHILVTFDGSIGAGAIFRIWVDGTEVSYVTQDAANGAYQNDAAWDFFIGNFITGNRAVDGKIGWCRISDNLRYAANFTPIDRCTLPAINGNTVAQWIGVEGAGATVDNQETDPNLDGTQTDCLFDFDCDSGRDETCLEEVYIANKHNQSQLTHILVDDGGVFGPNLSGIVTPFLFLPAVPIAGDIVYFGIDTANPDSGPFCSLVFDIGTAIAGVTGLVWEYWNGAWVGLTIVDNTNADGAMTGVAFDTVDVNSVHWEQPSDWVAVDLNAAAGGPAVTGYWVRARVTVAAGATAPTQQNRAIYSILWPYIEIAVDAIGGDIGALVRHIVKQQSSRSPTITTLVDNRITIGLRSVTRGTNFTAFLNLADEQNPSGVTAVGGANSAFANDVQTPTGRALVYTPAGVEALGNRGAVQFDSTITHEFYGTFHAFLRIVQTNGGAGDFGAQLRIDTDGLSVVSTDTLFTQLVAGSFEIFDFGQISLPGYELPAGYIPDFMSIQIWASAAGAGGRTLTFYDLIIIPVDEWAADYVDPTESPGGSIIGGASKMYLDADNITYPKRASGLSFVRNSDDDAIEGKYQRIGSLGPLTQSNAQQRIWYLSRYATASGTLLSSRIEVCHSMQSFKSQMYFYARGAR